MAYRKYECGALRADGRPGFETPTGKFELASEWFRTHGYDPLPVYTDPVEGPLSNPQLAIRYPLVFNSGARTQTAFRSQHHNIPSLSKRQPAPQVWLHPETPWRGKFKMVTRSGCRRHAAKAAIKLISPKTSSPVLSR
jgi:anaerobic selenocysteine-containing dehydrogenase